MASNYDDVLEQLRAAGLLVATLAADGATHRCLVEGDREKRGWYRLHELQLSGGDWVLVGSYGVWRGNDPGTLKVDLRRRDRELNDDQRLALRKRLDEDRRRALAERRRQAERAAARATAAWAKYSADGESEYLAAKCVPGVGVRYTSAGAAVVPLIDTTGQIHGLQFLRTQAQADVAHRPAKELWPTGMAKQGHYHLLGAPQWLILVVEGYATGASLHLATGYPVAVAIDAGNLLAVATALKKRYADARILVCSDDDILQKCRACKARLVLPLAPKLCPSCGEEHRAENAGAIAAGAAALAVGGAWIAPRFCDEDARRQQFLERGRKQTDFNDLHVDEGLHLVRAQIEDAVAELGWRASHRAPTSSTAGQGGEARLRPLQSVSECLDRYVLIYAHSGAVYDRQEHILMSLSDMRDACVRKDIHRAWCESPDREIARIREVGFDPGGEDPSITCNLWAGWPTSPKAGRCERILEMLWHMCSLERDAEKLYRWVLRWLAFPLQHPGAKMKTTIVVHGPQGTGKNLFFETVMAIYGQYGDVIDQSAVEDKFNDWASRKLFMIADEVVARMDVYHVKNKLKALITGNRIRINPKNFAAYWERNHLNLVFLSNETMPLVLEEDDRRHCIIWTPEKREAKFYDEVLAELASGGAEALHDYLLNLDLGDFHVGAIPPMTQAKDELISLAIDSPTRFYYALYEGEVGAIKPRPALTSDVYTLYKLWCHQSGNRPAPQHKFVNQLTRKHGIRNERKRYLGLQSVSTPLGPHGVVMLGETYDAANIIPETQWLGESIRAFRAELDDFKGKEK